MPGIRILPDIIKQSHAGYSLQDQIIVRVFQVQNLDSSFVPASLVAGSMFCVDSSDPSLHIPSLLEVHPDPALFNFIVVDLRTEPVDNQNSINVIVTYRYRLYATGFLSMGGGSLHTEKTVLRDSSGNPLPIQYSPNNDTANGISTAYLLTDTLFTHGTFGYKRMERMNPEYFNVNYAGCVNWHAWRGYPPRSVMILPILYSTEDNFWFHNQYMFEYHEETYDTYAVWKDVITGATPYDVVKNIVFNNPPDPGKLNGGNGWWRVPPKYQADFTSLFPWIPDVPPNAFGLDNLSFIHYWGE